MSFSNVLAQGSDIGCWAIALASSGSLIWFLFRFAVRSAVRPEFAEVNTRLDGINKHFEQVDQRFEQMDQRFDRLERRMESMDQRFDRLEQKIEALITDKVPV